MNAFWEPSKDASAHDKRKVLTLRSARSPTPNARRPGRSERQNARQSWQAGNPNLKSGSNHDTTQLVELKDTKSSLRAWLFTATQSSYARWCRTSTWQPTHSPKRCCSRAALISCTFHDVQRGWNFSCHAHMHIIKYCIPISVSRIYFHHVSSIFGHLLTLDLLIL